MPNSSKYKSLLPRPVSQYTSFQKLMVHRVQNILLVSSLYDSFLLAEDGELSEQMLSEFIDMNLRYAPGVTPVSCGKEALELVKNSNRFNLIITTMHIGDMSCVEFAKMVKDEGVDVPVVLLTYNMRELNDLMATDYFKYIDKVFFWQGDFRILLAIVKYVEDKLNVENDTREVGVQVIILVEDNVRFYSSYLPTIYIELMKQSQRLISEGVNTAHKLLRMRARPKILLCTSYEEAWKYYEKYEEHVLGVISDVDFPMGGKIDSQAGPTLVRNIKARRGDIPILLQSSRESNSRLAEELKVTFALKHSPRLLEEVRSFMLDNFGFGDFIFRMPDGSEVARAKDMQSVEKILPSIPDESIKYHAERDHFSNWLKARTEFHLAEKLKPKKVSDYKNIDHLRQYLIQSFRDFQAERRQALVVDFDVENFDPDSGFARIGGGSLGGKARGLAFVRVLIDGYNLKEKFPGIKIFVPPAVVIGTDTFDRFMEYNRLWDEVMQIDSDYGLIKRFLEADFGDRMREELSAFLEKAKYPLAVRSSSLMEDSQYQPFAGVYDTFMLPNSSQNLRVRLENLLSAIKRVYASTFSKRAKAYFRNTPYRLEEEKMAVIVQKLVGAQYGERFYPNFSGVARSNNFYPKEPLKSEDGMAVVALGLGKTVVEGEPAVSFCPKYPRHLIQFSSAKDTLTYSQKKFYYIDYHEVSGQYRSSSIFPKEGTLESALEDGSLGLVGSVYSPENNSVSDGVSREGIPLVTFAPILKHKIFPLPEILDQILQVGYAGMSTHVEIEFAVNMNHPAGQPDEFGFLQMRPLVLSPQLDDLKIEDYDISDQICSSMQVLGNGIIEDIKHIVMVDINKFDRSESVRVAKEVGFFNAKLVQRGDPYLLIGMGRWGSADPWLGIPVKWEEISGAKVIVETGFKNLEVEPSQGSHFFQNLTSLMIGYFTVNPHTGNGHLDWDWLLNIPANEEGEFIRLIELPDPVSVRMNGYKNLGVILKPGAKENSSN